MPASNTEKESRTRLMCLFRILRDRTDYAHPLTTEQIRVILQDEYGIKAYRTTIKEDAVALQSAGIGVSLRRSTQNLFYYEDQAFDSQDLRELILAILLNKAVKKPVRQALADKLAALAGPYKYGQLLAELSINGHIKPSLKLLYDRLKVINEAIESKKKVSFDCKRRQLRWNPEIESLVMSPYAVIYCDDWYYVVGYSESHRAIIGRRTDLIVSNPVLLEEDAVPHDPGIDLNQFIYCTFQGTPFTMQDVSVQTDDRTLPAVIERFGPKSLVTHAGDGTSQVSATVPIGDDFYSWIFGFGGMVRILEPENMKLEYENRLLASAVQVLEERQKRIW